MFWDKNYSVFTKSFKGIEGNMDIKDNVGKYTRVSSFDEKLKQATDLLFPQRNLRQYDNLLLCPAMESVFLAGERKSRDCFNL